ncbi:MAG: DUF1499 domain-containing protein [Porphyrobacter sp.]|nr:DUF1499 domain-containing protein [Porphyrobacter sp.]
MKNLPWHTKLVLALTAFLPLYFLIAAFGTRIGIWGWQTGLLALTLGGGVILLGITALAALVSLVIALRAKPRRNGVLAAAIIGLLVPGAIFLVFLSAGAKAGDNPIHDISTDTANPPAFSAETMAAREAAGANPLSDYQTPLGRIPLYADGAEPVSGDLAVKSHAQIITDRPDRPAPLPLGGATREEGVAAVAAAMGNMGLKDIRTNVAEGRVEGVAQSFWFGFKDDVVARVGDTQIDFRSVSRVGRSDLGANTARIKELRKQTEALLGTASR